jgi:exopolysaccharide production protein ExoZ
MMVVLYHSRGPLRHLGYEGAWPEGLLSGVDIFFVISGFVMWTSTCRGKISPLKFYSKRIVRIVPLYWVMTAIVLLVLLLVPSLVQTGRLEAGHVVASFLFLPAVHPVTGLIQPLLIPGWTLNMEMYFYALFGCCLFLPVAARIPACWVLLLVPVLLAHVLAKPDVAVRFFGNGIVLDFGLGLVSGGLFSAGLRLPAFVAFSTSLGGFLLLAVGSRAPNLPARLAAGPAAFAVVAGCVAFELAGRLPGIPLLGLLGDASYSLYLSHTLALSALDQAAHALGVRTASLAAAAGVEVFLLLSTAVVGVLVFRCIEQPLASLLRGPLFALREPDSA